MDLGGVAMTMRKMRSMTVSKNRYKMKKVRGFSKTILLKYVCHEVFGVVTLFLVHRVS